MKVREEFFESDSQPRKVAMGTLVVYSEDSADHRYTICQNEESDSYFLVIDEQTYEEGGRMVEGTFDDMLDKLKELRAVEDLKTI